MTVRDRALSSHLPGNSCSMTVFVDHHIASAQVGLACSPAESSASVVFSFRWVAFGYNSQMMSLQELLGPWEEFLWKRRRQDRTPWSR